MIYSNKKTKKNVSKNSMEEWIERQNAPMHGWEQSSPIEQLLAKEKISAAKKVLRKIQKNNLNDSQEIYELGYKNGFAEGRSQQLLDNHNHMQMLRNQINILQQQNYQQQRQQIFLNNNYNGNRFSYEEVERIKESQYRNGYNQGMMVGKTEAMKELKARDRSGENIMNKVYDECRVISESNPNMEPAINALKHRLKKIKL